MKQAGPNSTAFIPTKTDRKTFDEWSALGFKICKGSRHVARRPDGICLFDGSQVELTQFSKAAREIAQGRRPPPGSGEEFYADDDVYEDGNPIFDFQDTQDADPFDDIPF